MAERTVTQEGETCFGTDTPGLQGALHIRNGGVVNRPSMLVMDSIADDGTKKSWALWVDSTGDVRIIELTTPEQPLYDSVTNQDGDGTVVGNQS